jgi:hypothetical protein
VGVVEVIPISIDSDAYTVEVDSVNRGGSGRGAVAVGDDLGGFPGQHADARSVACGGRIAIRE